MESLLKDLSHTARTLLRNPRFTLATLLTLVLGIGIASAVFSIVNAVLLTPLPYDRPDRLVRLWNHFKEMEQVRASDPELFHYQDRLRTFEKVAGFVTVDLNLTGGDIPERVKGVFATADLLPVLGVPAARGRHFSPEDDAPGASPTVVLSHGLWQRRFGARSDILEQTVFVNAVPRRVVGVMPPGFDFPGEIDLWMPIGLDRANPGPDSARYLEILGRLKPGVTYAESRADIASYVKQVYEQFGLSADLGWGVDLVPLLDQEVGQARKILWILLGAVGLLLLITSANVANILLTRLASRDREIALRTALGAGRGRLVRQILAESLLLALAGGGLGLLLGHWAVTAFVAANPDSIPRAEEIALDGRVALFTLGLAVVTGLLVGLLPAFRAGRSDLVSALKEGGGKTTGGPAGQRPRRLLVVTEVALALVLLVGAALLVRSFQRLSKVDPGFNPQGVVTLQLALPRSKYPGNSNVAQFHSGLLARVRALPGVRSADLINHLPFSGSNVSSSVLLEGQVVDPTKPYPEPNLRSVSPGYFETLGIPVIRGRAFTDSDDAGKPLVVVVDETLAKLLWPGRDPIGQRLRQIPVMPGQETPLLTVVGVVRPIRGADLAAAEPRGELYFPMAQSPERVVYLAARTTGAEPLSLVPAVREEVRALDPEIPIADARTLDDRLGRALAQPRFAMQLLGLFAAVALLLSAIGVFGVVAYSVAQRNREIGIRMAVGAERGAILRGVLTQEMAIVLAGIGIGVVAAFYATRLLATYLYEIGAADPWSFLGVSLLLLGVALLAALGPAWKASRTPPATVLRQE